MSVARAEVDPLGSMLVWSFALHGLVLGAVLLGVSLQGKSSPLPPSDGTFINVSLGASGPITGGGGQVTPAPQPKPAPPPEPPKEKAPEVVRPTKEVREEIPANAGTPA